MKSKQHYGLWVKNRNCFRLIPFERITHIYHKSGYSHINMSHITLSKIRVPLCTIEKQLPFCDFFRIHRNYIINRRYIMQCDHLLKYVITKSGEKITISRRKKDKFLQFLIQ